MKPGVAHKTEPFVSTLSIRVSALSSGSSRAESHEHWRKKRLVKRTTPNRDDNVGRFFKLAIVPVLLKKKLLAYLLR